MQQLAINGNDIMQQFDVTPGPIIKAYLEKAFYRVSDNIADRNNTDQIVAYLKKCKITV